MFASQESHEAQVYFVFLAFITNSQYIIRVETISRMNPFNGKPACGETGYKLGD
jgi:hypothetical protein